MYFGFSKREEFYYAVEKGDVDPAGNIHKLLKEKTDMFLFKYVKQGFRVATESDYREERGRRYTEIKTNMTQKELISEEEAFERNYDHCRLL